MTVLDRRLHAYRPDIADERLEGQVTAERFVAGMPARIGTTIADVLREGRQGAPLDTQFLFGDEVAVFERSNGFAWVQGKRDGYVGFIVEEVLVTDAEEPTHVVSAPRTFLYPGPDLRFPRAGRLSMGSRVRVVGHAETRGTTYSLLPSGEAIVSAHLVPVDETIPDYVSAAELLIHTPYLWGGVSGFGIDCSGLVQLSMLMAGKRVQRDSDMQAAGLGIGIDPGAKFEDLRRGDLVFWKGHVAIMTDAESMIHANGHTMTVSREGLAEAIDRIGYLYGGPTGFRRP